MPDPSPELMFEIAKRHMAQEMPKEYQAATILPMGNFAKAIYPNDEAVTSPFNTIRYNPSSSGYKSQNEIDDILAHELTHVRQNMNAPLMQRLYDIFIRNQGPYNRRPNEMEAFQTEKNRALRDHRPGIVDSPPFTNGDDFIPGDIELPAKKTAN